MIIRLQTAEDHLQLVAIWLDAVRATHHFLSEEEIQSFLPLVRDVCLTALEVWVVEDTPGEPLGFMGLDGAKVEALFVAPAHHGRGIGRALLAHAEALKGRLTVDVNEQNPEAVAFYKRCGFTQTGRSDLDGMGKPFPLIHMAQVP
ncbi:acetyltransferase [Azospirillum soli]|uniref:acetyltransferase n=1 Tax=Azospirillum soli TaxID=1304799 RepID=UPI001AE87693|nr:acetyltransferase [Azospirillum soli]MBP2310802.1 putative acetyltransferase [Azospirillum soli]